MEVAVLCMRPLTREPQERDEKRVQDFSEGADVQQPSHDCFREVKAQFQVAPFRSRPNQFTMLT